MKIKKTAKIQMIILNEKDSGYLLVYLRLFFYAFLTHEKMTRALEFQIKDSKLSDESTLLPNRILTE